jgi:hypothetical protein
VGSVDYYPYVAGQQVRTSTGQVQLSGSSLANPGGSADDVLLVAGQVQLTGPVADIGYARVIVVGQLVAPESTRSVVEHRFTVQGQVVWTRSENARVILADMEIGPDFFRLLPEPVSLVVLGDLTFTAGVTEQLVQAKVTDIALIGSITAPAEVVPVLQVLAEQALGEIRVSDGSGG